PPPRTHRPGIAPKAHRPGAGPPIRPGPRRSRPDDRSRPSRRAGRPRAHSGRPRRRRPPRRRAGAGAMLTLGLTGRSYVCIGPQDGRKSFDGLAAVVTGRLGRDPLSGDLYVFRNRRGDRLKVLAWQGDGFALYLRRLEKGTFAFPTADAAEMSVTA